MTTPVNTIIWDRALRIRADDVTRRQVEFSVYADARWSLLAIDNTIKWEIMESIELQQEIDYWKGHHAEEK